MPAAGVFPTANIRMKMTRKRVAAALSTADEPNSGTPDIGTGQESWDESEASSWHLGRRGEGPDNLLCWSAGAAWRYDRGDHSRRPGRHVLEGQTPEDQNPDYEQGVSRVDMDGVSDRRSEEVESEEDDQESQDVDEEDADKAYGEKRNQPRELGLDVDQSHAPQEPEGQNALDSGAVAGYVEKEGRA